MTPDAGTHIGRLIALRCMVPRRERGAVTRSRAAVALSFFIQDHAMGEDLYLLAAAHKVWEGSTVGGYVDVAGFVETVAQEGYMHEDHVATLATYLGREFGWPTRPRPVDGFLMELLDPPEIPDHGGDGSAEEAFRESFGRA